MAEVIDDPAFEFELDRQAQEQAEKVLEKLPPEKRAEKLPKVKEGILKRLRAQANAPAPKPAAAADADAAAAEPEKPPEPAAAPPPPPPVEPVEEQEPVDYDGVEMCGDEQWFDSTIVRRALRESVAAAHAEQKILVGPGPEEIRRICPSEGHSILAGAVFRLGGAHIGGYGEADIAYAYRQLSRAIHPDKNAEIEEAPLAFKRLTEASEELRQGLGHARGLLNFICSTLGRSVAPEMLERPQEALLAEASRLLAAVLGITGEGNVPEKAVKRGAAAFASSIAFGKCEGQSIFAQWFQQTRLLDVYGAIPVRRAYDCSPKRFRAQFLCALNRVCLLEAQRQEGHVRHNWQQVIALFPELDLWRSFLEMLKVHCLTPEDGDTGEDHWPERPRKKTWAAALRKYRSNYASRLSGVSGDAQGTKDDPICWTYVTKGFCRQASRCKYLHQYPPGYDPKRAYVGMSRSGLIKSGVPVKVANKKAEAAIKAAEEVEKQQGKQEMDQQDLLAVLEKATTAQEKAREKKEQELKNENEDSGEAGSEQKSKTDGKEENGTVDVEMEDADGDKKKEKNDKEGEDNEKTEKTDDKESDEKKDNDASDEASKQPKFEGYCKWARMWRELMRSVLPVGSDGAMAATDPEMRKLSVALWRDVVEWANGKGLENHMRFFKAEPSGRQDPTGAIHPCGDAAEWAFVPATDILLVVGEGIVGITCEGLFADGPTMLYERETLEAASIRVNSIENKDEKKEEVDSWEDDAPAAKDEDEPPEKKPRKSRFDEVGPSAALVPPRWRTGPFPTAGKGGGMKGPAAGPGSWRPIGGPLSKTYGKGLTPPKTVDDSWDDWPTSAAAYETGNVEEDFWNDMPAELASEMFNFDDDGGPDDWGSLDKKSSGSAEHDSWTAEETKSTERKSSWDQGKTLGPIGAAPRKVVSRFDEGPIGAPKTLSWRQGVEVAPIGAPRSSRIIAPKGQSRVVGKVKTFSEQTGWGLISYQGQDIYLYLTECEDGKPMLGDVVNFQLAPDDKRKGSLKALKVTGCSGMLTPQKTAAELEIERADAARRKWEEDQRAWSAAQAQRVAAQSQHSWEVKSADDSWGSHDSWPQPKGGQDSWPQQSWTDSWSDSW